MDMFQAILGYRKENGPVSNDASIAAVSAGRRKTDLFRTVPVVVSQKPLGCSLGFGGVLFGGLLETVSKPREGIFWASWGLVLGFLGASWDSLGASWG